MKFDNPRGKAPFRKPFEQRSNRPTFNRPVQKTVDDYRAEKKEKAAVLEDWIWGEHSIETLAETNPENLLEIFVENTAAEKIGRLMQKLAGLKVSRVERLPKFLSEKRTQGIAAKIRTFPVLHENEFFDGEIPESLQVVVLDRIQDPQNFGAILRSAAALGAKTVFIGRREQSPVNGTVALVSAGNLFRVNIYTASNLSRTCERLKNLGFAVYGLEMKGTQIGDALAQSTATKIAWVLGAEEDGIQSSVRKSLTESIGIPMAPGVESLNVSNSAAIALYEGFKKLKA